ncbi:hypothetical protein GCM10010156_48880 [Planobispora rosea]|uniref:Uncharacterized protein n=1 Tax=Planobispora rosea TaxID=35762 RepID=A0A8J3S3Z6_PLARO|nr:hypothetical protein [Planobispora rosea]GGS84490.1 hypothetical protein GCM10010156_48880 [Planobispora rosea]GIH86399.1 hypothetical protein Pro02_48070 [Planobispora rosea]
MSITAPDRRASARPVTRQDLVLIATEYGELLAAARATIAAAELGEPNPLEHLRHALKAHGQLPPAGARPVLLLAQCAVPITGWAEVTR